MTLSRMELDGATTPAALVTRLLELMPDLTLPVPIEQLCASLDIVGIGEMATNGFEAALITDALKADGAILVAGGRSRQRRRFSIAHELGHFLMPSHLPPLSGFQCTAQDLRRSGSLEDRRQRMEVEANRFAGLLLMPPPHLRAALARLGRPTIRDILSLADQFDVSKEAMARSYADFHHEPVAVVVSRDNRVLRTYRRKPAFPWLDVEPGQAVPAASALHNHRLVPGEIGNVQERRPEIWLPVREADKVSALTEQVLGQRNGFALTLLHAVLRDEGDEDERELERSWRPSF